MGHQYVTGAPFFLLKICSKSVLLLVSTLNLKTYITLTILAHNSAFCNRKLIEIYSQIKYTFTKNNSSEAVEWRNMLMQGHCRRDRV